MHSVAAGWERWAREQDGRALTAAHTISGSESQTAFPRVAPGPAPRHGLCLLWTCPHVCSRPQIPHLQALLLRLAGKNRLTLAGWGLWRQTARVRRCWLHLLTCLEGRSPTAPPVGPHIPNQPASAGPSRQSLPLSPALWSHSLTERKGLGWVRAR